MKDYFALDLIKAGDDKESSVLLMQDAVYEEFPAGRIKIFACEEDLNARQIESRYHKVSFDEISRMVADYDRTIVW